MKTILTLNFVLITFFSFCQKDLSNAPEIQYFKSKNHDSFLVSTEPVTNRMYLIYLLWIYNVNGIDYPDNVLNNLPGIGTNNDIFQSIGYYESSYPFHLIFEHTDPYVKNYIFNPKYLDYPVIGLSNLQASNLCKWLSDRYNECNLIKLDYFKPDSFQIDEECFVTESYLFEQYYGARLKDETITWKDRILIPAYRLPTSMELSISKSKGFIDQEIKKYPFDTLCFLNQWNKWYIEASDTSLLLKFRYNQSELITLDSQKWIIDNINYEEMTLDMEQNSKQLSLFEVFKQNGQPIIDTKGFDVEKDSLGRMPFIIIDENDKKEPIAILMYTERNASSSSTKANPNKFFRYSCSMRKNQYIR